MIDAISKFITVLKYYPIFIRIGELVTVNFKILENFFGSHLIGSIVGDLKPTALCQWE